MKDSTLTHHPDIVQQFRSFKGFDICTSSTNKPAGPKIFQAVDANASQLRPSPSKPTALTITPVVAASEQNEDFYLCVRTDWPGLGNQELRKDELLSSIVKLGLRDSVDGYLQSVNISMEGDVIVKYLKHILECFG